MDAVGEFVRPEKGAEKKKKNSGSHRRPHREWRRMTAADSTWSSTASLLGEGRCAATPHWSLPCRETVSRRGTQRMKTGLRWPRLHDTKRHACFTRLGGWGPLGHAGAREPLALVRLRRLRAPPAVRNAAATAWVRRWWTQLSVAVQRATACRRRPAPRQTLRRSSSCWTSPTRRGPAPCRFDGGSR